MNKQIIFVVGDKFFQFSHGKNVLTVSQLRGLMTVSGLMIFEHNHVEIQPGQGLSDQDVLGILQLAAASPHSERFDLSALERMSRRAPASQSHKHKSENTLISMPRQLSEREFLLDLVIDENCELMRDHQTGQHLQGMILLEAARQSFLAVSEAFFLPEDGTKFYFVIHEMVARYHHFAFPLPAVIRYRLREHEGANPLRQHFVADITVEQCGEVVSSFVTDFTAFEDSRISVKEGKLAEASCSQATSAVLGTLSAVA
ncbi:MAG TPA: AfsA-related hotdog domain-containing protein [Candidatus Sulfotelmatobacter sp.]|jgi:hypothetical protein|nr:AfsA-related hotdog domain-containing protein [Candidatus Sulfotelmatobacter sp.]